MCDSLVGIKCIGHDTSVFVLNEGEKPFGLDRERVTRHKHDVGFPYEPLEMARERLGGSVLFSVPDVKSSYRDIRFFSNRDVHSSNFQEAHGMVGNGSLVRLARRFRGTPPARAVDNRKGLSIVRRNIRSVLKRGGFGVKRYDHHICHAAGAFYPSGLGKACVITMDGEGDDYSSKVYIGNGGSLRFVAGSDRFNSIGHVYGAFTEALGMRRDHDEGKVEALGGFGSYKTGLFEKLRKRIHVRGLEVVVEKPFYYRRPDIGMYRSIVKQYGEKDSAAAIQRVLEDVGLGLVRNAIDRFGIRDFCFSGGCFANVQMNMRIFEEAGTRSMHIAPAMNDAGVAEGAAMLAAAEKGWNMGKLRHAMPYFGPSFGQDEIRKALMSHGSEIEFGREEDWPERVAELVSEGRVVGFYQGNMEYGPRALGNRSVIADARRKEIKDKINTTIKRRKPYQPFCPSVLESERKRIFEGSYQNRHMTCAFRMKDRFREELPSGIHIDGTARPQFVEKGDNPNYFRMLSEFRKLTGFGFVINTSFNLHGRTIVMTPEDAIRDFLDCGLDYMAMEGWIVKRKSQ